MKLRQAVTNLPYFIVKSYKLIYLLYALLVTNIHFIDVIIADCMEKSK